jgi:hypothetical protein
MKEINLRKELESAQTVLALVPSIEYNHVIADVAKQFSGKKVCYVTLNKTHKSLEDLFKANKVNIKDIVFNDGISKTLKKTPEQTDHCFFCSSPAALTELSITIRKLLPEGFDYLIFDSVTTLSVYETSDVIAKFIASLVNKIKETKTKAVFYAVGRKDEDRLVRESAMFVDNVVELE